MTGPSMHPVVLEKLQQFSRQRRRLILWRGICGTLAIWFGTMIGLALLDRFVLIPDELRWALSLVGYGATVVMFWFECGRYLVHMPDVRQLARLVELTAPQLREELLSAVELAESEGKPHWDSEEFRAALQQAAARDVGGLQIKGLLTKRLIAGWLYTALATVLVLIALFCVPGLEFMQSFARAVLPAANLARYSSVQITVVAPTPPDQIVPEGDNIPVTVALNGAAADQVILETIPHHGPRERTAMALSGVNQFTAAVQLNQEPVQFRIRARDAITRKYTLTPRARPQVVRFQKIYHYPTYSLLPAKTVTEENGDLDALEGTEVELTLAVDQPIQTASLQFELGNGKTAKREMPLQTTGTGTLTARVPLTTSGIYQVHLVAAQTRFENKFSPQYEIRVRPDLIPFVKIDTPEKDQLVLPPDSIVNLTGTAKDDLALSNVEQAVQINRGPWQTFPLSVTNAAETKVARTWDLFELGVHPGDRVLTKLVATDLKGQRGESAPLRIMIATAGFDPDRLKHIKERQALDKSLHELRETAEKLDQATHAAHAAVHSPEADTLRKQQAVLAATTAAADAQQKTDDVLRQIKEMLPHVTTHRDSTDLALVGAALSRAKHEGMEPIKAAMERAAAHSTATDDKAARKDLSKVQDEPLWAGVGLVRTADDAHRQMLVAAEAQASLRDLQQLAAEQRALNDQLRTAPNDATQAERVTRRQTVAADEVKQVEEQLKDIAEHTWDWPSAVARDHGKELARTRENLEKSLTVTAEPTLEKLKAPSDQLQHSIENAATNMRNAERELIQRADNARRNLEGQAGTAADAIAKLAEQLQRRDAPAPPPENWQAATDELKDRAALEERRPHADPQFAADTGRTAEALQALQDTAGADPQPTNAIATVKAIEQAFRKLQTGHAVAEEIPTLHQLAAKERWEKPAVPADALDRATDWRLAQQQMQALPQQIERAQLPAEAKRAAEQLPNSQPAQQVNNEMNQRQANPTPGTAVPEPLNKLAGEVAQVRKALQPALDAARAEIDKLAPKLSERLAGLAKTAEKMKTDTAAKAQDAAKPENTPKVREEAKNLAGAQQHLDNRVEDVQDALRRDANEQNLGSEEGRQRARDADDATAMLRQPTPSANDHLQAAANTQQPDKQQSNLNNAAEQQGKLADALKQLAEHYKNLEKGQPEPTRTALRNSEKELGLKATLDSEYAKAQALEALAGKSPQDQLKELEQALHGNKPMQHELSDIAKDALHGAAADLQNAATKEQQIAQQMGSPAEQAKQIAEAAKKLAHQDIPATTEKAGPTGDNAKPDLNNAGQKLDGVAQNVPQDFSKPPEQLAQAMQNQVAPLQQAASDLNNAANKLGQDAQQAQQQANNAAQQTQQARNNKAGEQAVKQAEAAQQQAQHAAESAHSAQQQAQQEAAQASQLAQQAAQVAQAFNQTKPQMQAAAAQQPGVEQAVREAGNDVERAGRHEERLGNEAMGQQLEQLGNQVENQTGNQVAQDANTMAQAATPAQDQAAAQDAKNAIQPPLDKLNAALGQPPPAPNAVGQPESANGLAAAPAEAAQWMARALDSLDAALHPAPGNSQAAQPAPGQQPGQPAPPAPGQGQQAQQGQPSPASQAAQNAAAQAAAEAAQAQASAMMGARGQGLTPGQQPFSDAQGEGKGAAFTAAGLDIGQLPDALRARGNWGKLPPKLANDLLESKREGVSGEYREMVDLYFRAVADKAREKQP